MPSERYEIRVPVKRLLIGLLLTIVPICLAGLWTISQSERALVNTIGTHFRTIAEGAATEIAAYIHERVVNVSVMANEPTVVDAVTAANLAYQGMSETAISERIQRIENEWNTPAAEATVRGMLASRASRTLRHHRELDPRFLRVTVTDVRGATVAATHKTLDYFQADEDFWQAIYAQGRGTVNLTDILYDEVTKSNYIGIGVPVVEEGTQRFIGAVDALVDVTSLFPFVNRVQLGPTSRAALVKEDGTIIAAPGVVFSMNLKSDIYAAVQDALRTLHGRQTGYMVADVSGGARKLIGFADTGLKADYRNLGWAVLVSQDSLEAFAPVRTVSRFLAFMALVGLAVVVFFGVYFSLHRRPEMTDIQGALKRSQPAERKSA
jgi:Cache domain